MGSSLLKLGGVALRETGEQVLKRLAGESDRAAKVIGALHEPIAKAVIKEIDEYAPAAEIVKGYVRNGEFNEFGAYGKQLFDEPVIKNAQQDLGNILGKNKPQPEVKLPSRYDVKGKEGKKFVETEAKSWFDEKLDSIGWNPERTGEINRGEFASEGVYIDMGQGAEKYNFGGLTKYAKDRKTIPRLTKASQSEAQLNRLSSEVSQTFGPAFRAKPELVDQLGEVVPPKKVHKHHVLLLKVMEPFTMLTGGRTRSRKDMKYIFDGLAKRDWWIGNTDKNLVWQRIQTHIEDMLGSHGQLKGMTDIQGRPKGEKFIEGFGPTEIPGKTYDPKARHGFSEQFIEEIQKEKDPKVVLAKLLMFLEEGGGGEAMEGAAYSAQKAMEPRAVIKQTGKIKDVKSGDIVADRRLQNPRIQQNVERFEKGTAKLRK